jgi:alkylhydroperoxidase family enzyme
MCCIRGIAKYASAESITNAELPPFDAAIFFRIQHQMGLDPHVRGQSIGRRVGQQSACYDCMSDWARVADPDGKQRAKYAAERWNRRELGEIIVSLG